MSIKDREYEHGLSMGYAGNIAWDRAEIISEAIKLDSEQFDSETCAARPGKYEGANDLALVVALDMVEPDETAGNVEYGEGHFQRYGQHFILITDNLGFCTAEILEYEKSTLDRMSEAEAFSIGLKDDEDIARNLIHDYFKSQGVEDLLED